jgi:hypothetical protein
MREQQGPGAYFPQRSSLVTTAGGVPTREASVQTRRTGTSSQQRAAPAKQQHRQQQIQEDEEMVDEEEEVYDEVWPARMPTSARRYQPLPAAEPVVIRQGNRQYILHSGPHHTSEHQDKRRSSIGNGRMWEHTRQKNHPGPAVIGCSFLGLGCWRCWRCGLEEVCSSLGGR